MGTAKDESISGQGGQDRLEGGGGRDRLSGGMDADVFRFTDRDDSYRTASENVTDGVVDFAPTQDVLDLSALGFAGLGDGHGHALAIRVNATGTRTYLKSFEADANGHRFELAWRGTSAAN